MIGSMWHRKCVRSEFACALSSPLSKPVLTKMGGHLHSCTLPELALSYANPWGGRGWSQLFGALGFLTFPSRRPLALCLYCVTVLLREGLMVLSLGFLLRLAWTLTGSLLSLEFLAQSPDVHLGNWSEQFMDSWRWVTVSPASLTFFLS